MICNKIFANKKSFHEMSKHNYHILLSLFCRDTYFIFNDQLYVQYEGCSMGSPNAPILANIFLPLKIFQLLQDCLPEYKPFYYKRVVDDNFVTFNNSEQSQQFLVYLNWQRTRTFNLHVKLNSTPPFHSYI